MKRILILITLALTLLSWNEGFAQREKGQTAKEQMKDQQKKEEIRNKENNKAVKAKHDRHHTIQDKATRKRMKKTSKKHQKHSQGKTIPFYKRWFRKKNFK